MGRARIINQLHGAPVVTVWDVDEIDELWLDVFMGVAHDLPAKRKRIKEVNNRFKKFESEHPTYGKRLRN